MGAPKYKIAGRALRYIGKDLGRTALKLSYPLTGALPRRCQEYLGEHFDSYNPVTANRVSSGVQTLVMGSFLVYKGLEKAHEQGINESLMPWLYFVYNVMEGILRFPVEKNGKMEEVRGSLMFKIPLLPFEYIYDKFKKASDDLELEIDNLKVTVQ